MIKYVNSCEMEKLKNTLLKIAQIKKFFLKEEDTFMTDRLSFSDAVDKYYTILELGVDFDYKYSKKILDYIQKEVSCIDLDEIFKVFPSSHKHWGEWSPLDYYDLEELEQKLGAICSHFNIGYVASTLTDIWISDEKTLPNELKNSLACINSVIGEYEEVLKDLEDDEEKTLIDVFYEYFGEDGLTIVFDREIDFSLIESKILNNVNCQGIASEQFTIKVDDKIKSAITISDSLLYDMDIRFIILFVISLYKASVSK